MPCAGPRDIPSDEVLPSRGALWANLTSPPCGLLGRGQHRRGIGPPQQEGIPALPRHCAVFAHRGWLRPPLLKRSQSVARRCLEAPRRPAEPRAVSHLAAVPIARPRLTSTNLHQPRQPPLSSTKIGRASCRERGESTTAAGAVVK